MELIGKEELNALYIHLLKTSHYDTLYATKTIAEYYGWTYEQAEEKISKSHTREPSRNPETLPDSELPPSPEPLYKHEQSPEQ
jgi:hypothetical protein